MCCMCCMYVCTVRIFWQFECGQAETRRLGRERGEGRREKGEERHFVDHKYNGNGNGITECVEESFCRTSQHFVFFFLFWGGGL